MITNVWRIVQLFWASVFCFLVKPNNSWEILCGGRFRGISIVWFPQVLHILWTIYDCINQNPGIEIYLVSHQSVLPMVSFPSGMLQMRPLFAWLWLHRVSHNSTELWGDMSWTWYNTISVVVIVCILLLHFCFTVLFQWRALWFCTFSSLFGILYLFRLVLVHHHNSSCPVLRIPWWTYQILGGNQISSWLDMPPQIIVCCQILGSTFRRVSTVIWHMWYQYTLSHVSYKRQTFYQICLFVPVAFLQI